MSHIRHMFRFYFVFSPACIEKSFVEMTLGNIKETRRTRITVTSSLYEISTDKLENMVVVRGEEFFGSGEVIEDDVNSLSSSSDICFMLGRWK